MEHTGMRSPRTFYFDMDGVLAIYEDFRHIPIEQRPFYEKGGHYFLHTRPDRKALEIFQALYDQNSHDTQTKVLTRILGKEANADRALVNEWWNDKREWLLANTRNVDIHTCFCFSGPNKGDLLASIPEDQRKYHILIDDYNQNLMNWQAAGGTGVKYINDLNTPESFKGVILLKSWSAADCVNTLLTMPCQ